MKRKKALKKQLKKLMKMSEKYSYIDNQQGLTKAIVMVAREMRKGKKGGG